MDVARIAAQEAVQTFGQTDRFQILTSALDGKQQRLHAREQAMEEISKVEIGPYERNLGQVIARQREALASSNAPVKKAFIFSDLQEGVLDVGNWRNDSTIPTVIIPIESNAVSNLYIDSVWFATPVRRLQENELLTVRIRNTGEQNMENIPMRLFLNGEQRAVATFSAPAGGYTDTTMRFTYARAGFQEARVEIDDSPIRFDNTYHLSYKVAERTDVLILSAGQEESDRALASIFGGDSLHRAVTLNYRKLDLGTLDTYDLILLNQLPEIPTGLARILGDMIAAGGSVCLIPPSDGDPNNFNPFTSSLRGPLLSGWDTTTTRVASIALDDPFYEAAFMELPRNVDLPVIKGRYTLSRTPMSNPVLKLQDGSPFHSITQFQRGQLHVIGSPLGEQYGNYMRHAIFVAGILRMAETSRPSGQLSYPIGEDVLIPITDVDLDGADVPHLIGPEGIDVVPELRRAGGRFKIVLHDNDLYAGNYWLTLAGDTLQGIALDYPRKGSDMQKVTPEALQKELEMSGLDTFTVLSTGTDDLSVSLSGLDQGVKFWKWCILLALIFLLLESALLRWMR
jgi:hypothetical protein